LPLPWILRRLGPGEDGSHEREYNLARRAAFADVPMRLDELRLENPDLSSQMEPLFIRMKSNAEHSAANPGEMDEQFVADVLAPAARLRQELIASAREAVLVLRDDDTIGDEARRRVERMLDFEELRFNA
jgi:hypothetical protein